MAETKTVNLNVETNLGSLKSQLKTAQKEVEALSEKFGVTSKEATNAARKAAELKDAIGDAKALTDAFNPDAKFNALSSSLGGVVSGFSAYQGALGLVGVESKDLEEQLLKIQSAMALSQGLQGLGEARDSFKQLGAVVKNVFTGIKGAIGATGIGLLVIGVGALVSNWKELTKWVEKSFPAFSKIGDFFSNFKQVASGTINSVIAGFKVVAQVLGDIFRGDFSKALKDAKNVGSQMSEAYNKGFEEKDRELKTERYIKQKTFELALEKAKGKDILDEQLKLQRKQLSLLDKGSEDYNAKLIEIEETKTSIREREQAKQDKIEEEAKKRREKLAEDKKAADKKAQEDAEKHKKELIDNANDLNDALIASDKARKDQAKKDQQDIFDNKKGFLQASIIINENDILSKRKLLEVEKDILLQNEELTQGEIAAINAKYRKDREQLDKDELAKKKVLEGQKIDAVQNTLSTIGNLAELFAGKSRKQQETAFKIQKAVNIANATIDTYKAATGAYSSLSAIPVVGPALGIAAAGLALSAGLLNVKKISSTKFDSGGATGGGGGGATSGGGGATTGNVITPNFNIVGANGTNQLEQLKQAPIQAYVVSGEMSTQQSLDRNRLRNATL